jgi:RNA polymerase sigma factor (sigma-70 family)
MEKGYRAFVDVYDDRYYIDTNTGEGFDKVLAKMDRLLNKFASTMYMYVSGYNFEDAKSELSIIAIEGIMTFDPHRDVKLSTFLHKHIHNKKITFIKSENKASKDASSLRTKDAGDGKKIKKVREELYFSQFKTPIGGRGSRRSDCDESHTTLFENTISELGKLDKLEFELSLDKICEKLDLNTRKIIELMYYKDCSIKDAAEEVGLSGWAASIELKKLAPKTYVKNVFQKA